MKKKNILIVISLVLTLTGCIGWWAYKYYVLPYYSIPAISDHTDYKTIDERAEAALAFAKSHGLSRKYCFLVDYSIPSGTPRMFVWDFEQQRIIASCYVMHGSGGGSTAEKPVFSNQFGSNCSSLGRFAVTKLHGNRQKRGFRLRGLDMDNQSAMPRGLLIHRGVWVDLNCWRTYIPLNSFCCQGCLTVSTRGFDYLEKIIYSEKRQILVWNYS